jgi:hypothetical protein
MKRTAIALTIFVGAIAVIFAAWVATYPSPGDPKSIQYVLWKAGLYNLPPDLATGAMVGDVNRDELVAGKTEEQLRRRFDLLAPAEATPYYRACDTGPFRKNRRVMFIKNSGWLIEFDRDKATDLVLCKGY